MSINWDNIEPGDDAPTLRTRFNNFLNGVANIINSPTNQSKWEAQGANDIKPKDGKGVVAPEANFANGRLVINDSDVRYASLGAPPAYEQVPILGIINDGGIHDKRIVRPQYGYIARLDADNLTLSGDLKLSKLATGGVPKPALIDEAGNVITELTEVGINTITINVYSETTSLPVSGYLTFFNLTGYSKPIQFSGTPSVFIENLPDISTTLEYRIDDANGNYKTYFGTIAGVTGSVFQEVFLEFIIGEDGDVIEGRGTTPISAGGASNADLRNPVTLIGVSVNHIQTLPDAEASVTVEFTSRKTETGGALTLLSNDGIVMDGKEGDLITTTVQGAWVVVKSVKEVERVIWHVIMDSGDWEVDDLEV